MDLDIILGSAPKSALKQTMTSKSSSSVLECVTLEKILREGEGYFLFFALTGDLTRMDHQ